MPPRLRIQRLAQPEWRAFNITETQPFPRYGYATAATTPAAPIDQMTTSVPLTRTYPSSQPPSYRAPEARRSQLLREYVSFLHATPLFILFQHNNLKANEWVGIRRELNIALKKLDDSLIVDGRVDQAIGSGVKLEIIRTNIFEPALRVAEYFQPPPPGPFDPTDPSIQTSAPDTLNASLDHTDSELTHALSRHAHDAAMKAKGQHPLTPLLTGPVAILSFPTVSPQYVKTALQILTPEPGKFPAPTRRASPGYWDPPVQDGIKKLMMLGARIEGKVFDMDGTKWVGTIEGGMDGLRAQVVQMLQGIGAGVTGALESASRNLYFTMEGRKNMLEEEQKPNDEGSSS